MSRRILDQANRIFIWFAVVLAICCIVLGAAFWIAGGGKDVGGMVGAVFFFPGVWLLIEFIPHVRRRGRS